MRSRSCAISTGAWSSRSTRSTPIIGTEACVQLLADDKLPAELHLTLKQSLATLDRVLPGGLPFVNDAKALAHIQAMARNRCRSHERSSKAAPGLDG